MIPLCPDLKLKEELSGASNKDGLSGRCALDADQQMSATGRRSAIYERGRARTNDGGL
jgi:hypothetical protein